MGNSEFTICDCNRPGTKGIINSSPPNYCKNREENVTVHTALYTLYSTQPVRTQLIATMCEKWEKVLKITGNFWVGSYDTEHIQYTVPVSPEECRTMKNSNKCGSGPEEHTMVESRGTHTYIAEPVGKGQWMREKMFRTINCQLRSITLWQENATGPVISPFGKLADDVSDRSAIVNHNTIIWDVPQTYFSKCDPIRFKDGIGKIHLTNSSARLMDTTDQIAFTYAVKPTHLCSNLPVHQIDGLPNAFVYIWDTEGSNPDLIIGKVQPSRTTRDISSSLDATLTTDKELELLDADTKRQLTTMALTRYAWGRIKAVDQGTKAQFVSSGRNNETLSIQLASEDDDKQPWEDFSQEFELNIDHTLRRLNTNRCVTVDLERVILQPCGQTLQPTRWTYEANLYLLVDLQTGLCLTLEGNQLAMRACARKTRKAMQLWLFEYRNVLPTFYTENSITSTEEFKQKQEEVVSATIKDEEDPNAVAFGQLQLYQHVIHKSPHLTCLTTLPRAFSQVYPLYCNAIFDNRHVQNMQILQDQTLRTLSGSFCLNRNIIFERSGPVRRLTTGPCSPASPKWFQLSTNQLAAIDLTNIGSEAECLTRVPYTKETVLELQPCVSETRLNGSQQIWKFTKKESPIEDRFSVHDMNNIVHHFKNLSSLKGDKQSERLKLWMDFRPNRGHAFTYRIKRLFNDRFNIVTGEVTDLIDPRSANETQPTSISKTLVSTIAATDPVTEPALESKSLEGDEQNKEPASSTASSLDLSKTIKPAESQASPSAADVFFETSSNPPSEIHHRVVRQNNSSSPTPAIPSTSTTSSVGAESIKTIALAEHSTQPVKFPSSTKSGSDLSPGSSKPTGLQHNMSEDDLKAFMQRQLFPLHEEWKQQIELDHENRLAKENRQLYCEILKIRHANLLVSSQWSGLLSAKSINLGTCSKLTNVGESLLLQECKSVKVKIGAVETRCGFQPKFTYNSKNFTVGRDGFSLQPFQECFWDTHLIPINDKIYYWRHNGTVTNGTWTEQQGTIPLQGLDLVSGFQHTILKDYDYELLSHYSHEQQDFEPINILSDIMGHLQGEGESSISNLVFNQKKEVDFGNLFSWTNTLKIGFIVVLAIIVLALLLQFSKMVIPKIQSSRQPTVSITPEDIPMLPRAYNPIIYNPVATPVENPPRRRVHKHDKCINVEGIGLVYEGCRCPK